MSTVKKPRLQSMKHEKEKVIPMQGSKPHSAGSKAAKNRQSASRERKLALQQDVDKLKKKLTHEENVHRALERAFSRPLGALPRLPPYLPPATLELLAEVAVLEEEVVRLEEQVVHYRQDLYQEAVNISSSKRNMESFADLYNLCPNKNHKPELPKSSAIELENGLGKENGSCIVSGKKNSKGSLIHKVPTSRTLVKKTPPSENKLAEKRLGLQKLQGECRVTNQQNGETKSLSIKDERVSGNDGPNKISEDIVRCLSSIFIRMSSIKKRHTANNLHFLSALVSEENEETSYWDPYGICAEFGKRDIGPYKNLFSIDNGTINPSRTSSSLFLFHRLKLLLGRLASVDLQNLTHQEKLAFWINIYNSCMMNAFLEYGIPESAEMVVELMRKAKINVGQHLLNAMTIEHFILRLPHHSKYIIAKGSKKDEMASRSKFGLELSEPLVSFALACGSWSSPAVRVYTAARVENELEVAKRDYLQAAIAISAKKFAIPKLLDWYLLDFAKDLESLLDWICLQLPSDLGKEAIKCLERGKNEPDSQFVQVMPYEFSFRYLFYVQ